MARVRVGIAAHNRAKLLQKALKSVREQDFRDIEIAVIDDGSTDETPGLLAHFPEVVWHREDVPKGYLDARNRLMKETEADYYVSLDDDAWFLDGDEISLAVELMDRRRELAALAFDILSLDRPDGGERKKAVKSGMFIGCGHMLRLSSVKEAGFYVPNPGNYGGEEKDLSIRLLDLGYEVALFPGVHVWHDKTMLARDLEAQHLSGVCNDLVFAVRRFPLLDLSWLLPAKVANHFVFALRHGLLKPYLGGLGQFLKVLPDAVRSRRPVAAGTLRKFRARARADQ